MGILFYITEDRDFHIEGLQRSEIVHSAGPRTSDNSHCYGTKCMHRSKTLQNEDLKRSKTLNSEGLQTPDELYSHSFNDSTHPLFEGTRGINTVLQKGLQALILHISMLMKIVLKYRHVFILMVFLTRAACTSKLSKLTFVNSFKRLSEN